MKVISFYNRKGGTGKTALSLLVSRYLLQAGERVLLLDLDPQKSLTEHVLRLNGEDLSLLEGRSAISILKEGLPADEVAVEVGGLHLVGSHDSLGDIQASASVMSVKRALKGAPYDVCIIDNAPNWSLLIQAALVASDLVVIPALPSIDDLEQALWTYETVAGMSEAQRVVLFNQYNLERAGERERTLRDYYAGHFGEDLSPITIPQSSLVRLYTDTAEPLTRARGKAVLFEPIRQLAEFMVELEQIPERF